MIRKPCSKCETTDFPKYRRKRKRKTGIFESMSSYCVMCHKDNQKILEARRYEKKLAYNRQWRKDNKDKKNSYNRKWYHKNKHINVIEGPVEWTGTKSIDGFSSLTYIPLWVGGSR